MFQPFGLESARASGGEFATSPEALPARPPREGRLALTKQVLQERPVAKPGTEMFYSNAGYVVAGVMVERLLDTPWEQLMTSLMFQPFGLESARFGWPATADSPHQPWGHLGAPPGLRPHEPGTFWNFDLTTYFAPAGDISCNVDDLAKYAAAHLRGLRGAEGVLTSASIRRLHTPPEIDAEGNGYASGWAIARTEDGRPEHWHSGSWLALRSRLRPRTRARPSRVYLALAEAEDARLVTADRRLLARLRGSAWQELARPLVPA
jgi:CubicO group peptidase (beta-lactamase class C family)